MVKLPSTYTQEDLIVNNREIATAEKLKKWKYLDTLKPNKSVAAKKVLSLLICANCVRPLINQTKTRNNFYFNRIMFILAECLTVVLSIKVPR